MGGIWIVWAVCYFLTSPVELTSTAYLYEVLTSPVGFWVQFIFQDLDNGIVGIQYPLSLFKSSLNYIYMGAPHPYILTLY